MGNAEKDTDGRDPDAVRIGEVLREIRNAKGWTLQRLGAAIGSTHSHLSKVERGHIKAQPPLCKAIATALDLSPEVVLGLAYGISDESPTVVVHLPVVDRDREAAS